MSVERANEQENSGKEESMMPGQMQRSLEMNSDSM